MMRKRGGQNIQEGANENPEKVKRNKDKCCPIHYDPMRKVSFVEISWAAGNVSVHGMELVFAELPCAVLTMCGARVPRASCVC